MLKRTLLLAFMFFVAATAMMQAPADKPGSDSPARFLPSDTFLYLEIRDISSTLQRSNSLALAKFFADEEMRAFLDALKTAFANEGDRTPQEYIDTVREALSAFGEGIKGEMCFAIPQLKDGRPSPGVLMVRYDAAKFAGIKDVLDQLADLGDGAFVFGTEKIGDVEAVTVMPEGEDKPVFYGMAGDMLLFTSDKDTFKAQAERMAKAPEKSLADNPVFLDLFGRAAGREVFWYYDNLQLARLMQPFLDMAGQMAGPVAGLVEFSRKFTELTTAMAGDLDFTGDDVVENLFSVFNEKADPEALKLIDAWRKLECKMKSARFMPKDSFLYFAMSVPFKDVYDLIEGMLPPEAANAVMEIENQLMLSFRDDIAPALGPEVGFSFNMRFMSPSFLAAIEVKDADTVNNAIAALPQLVPSLKKEEVNEGVALYRLPPLPGMPIQLAFVVHDGFLLFGTYDAVRFGLSGKGENITAAEGYKDILALTKTVQKPNFFFYLDTKTMMGFLYDNVMAFAQARLAAIENFDPAAIPSRDVFVEYMRPIGGCASYSGNVSHAVIKGMFPLAVFQVVNPIIYGLGLIQMPGGMPPQEDGEDIF